MHSMHVYIQFRLHSNVLLTLRMLINKKINSYNNNNNNNSVGKNSFSTIE